MDDEDDDDDDSGDGDGNICAVATDEYSFASAILQMPKCCTVTEV